MPPRRRCPVCRSRQWHKEPSSGLIVCSEGHILQDYRNETVEATEMGAHAVRKRTLKSTRNKQDQNGIGRSNPELYHGRRGTFLYYQCLQLVLRKQIAAIIQLWSLPSEFELLCRDLWALNLTLLPEYPPPEPYYYVHGENIDSSKENDPSGGEKPPPDNSDDEDDPLIAALQADSGSDEEDDISDDTDTAKPDRKKRPPELNDYRSMAGTISVLALACWMLRIPIMFSDFIRAIEAYELPYLEAVKVLPPAMVAHLTKYNVQSLSMRRPPKIMVLHLLTSRLAKKVNASFGISTPELNTAPMLWRVIRGFGGTPTLYLLTKQLSRILQLPLSVSHTLAPALERTKRSDVDFHNYDNVPAELGFVAGTIVVLKMVYGMDGIERLPNDPGDPAGALPQIDELLDLLNSLENHNLNQLEVLFDPEQYVSVGDLSDVMMDNYIEFCEAALHREHTDKTGMPDKYFPRYESSLSRENAKEHICAPLRATSVDKKPALRPGEKHKIYIAADNAGSVTPELSAVVRYGARLVRATEDDVFRVMERYERGIIYNWWKRFKRKRDEGKNTEE